MIKGIGFDHEKFNFPVGEMHIRLKDYRPYSRVSVNFHFEKNEDVIELLLVCDALKREGMVLEGIAMPYVPFGRQDRVAVSGESFSLAVFCELLNSCGAKEVNITDPHSDVSTALIKNVKAVSQHEVFERYLVGKKGFLVSPDGGALKKIYKLSQAVKLPVIECSKKRNVEDGSITGVVVHTENLEGNDCFIVDDICDGGRTFTEIAKVLKTKNSGKIILMVTHGFFTKGLEVFDGLIDEIYTLKGQVK
jgi:ribose-phosphate pyrophosphokinase